MGGSPWVVNLQGAILSLAATLARRVRASQREREDETLRRDCIDERCAAFTPGATSGLDYLTCSKGPLARKRVQVPLGAGAATDASRT